MRPPLECIYCHIRNFDIMAVSAAVGGLHGMCMSLAGIVQPTACLASPAFLASGPADGLLIVNILALPVSIPFAHSCLLHGVVAPAAHWFWALLLLLSHEPAAARDSRSISLQGAFKSASNSLSASPLCWFYCLQAWPPSLPLPTPALTHRPPATRLSPAVQGREARG